MLDHFAIHIGEVKSTVGSIGELDGAKPEVFRGDEFDLLFAGRTFGDQGHAVGIELFAMNQVAPNMGDESVAVEVIGKSVAAINGDARGRGEIAGSAPPTFDQAWDLTTDAPFRANYAPRFFWTDAIDLGSGAIGGNVEQAGRHDEVG